LVDHDEEHGGPVIEPLKRGPGDDLAGADGSARLDVGDEGLAHGGPELVREGGRAQGQDAFDVGLDSSGIEGGHGSSEPLDEAELVGVGDGKPSAAALDRSGNAEPRHGDATDERQTGSEAGAEQTVDHHETLPRSRLATWIVAGVLTLVGAAGIVLARVDDETSDREQVMAFSEDFIELFTEYDYVDFDRTEQAVAERSTHAFASRYRTLLGGAGFIDALRTNEARATSEITAGPLIATLDEHEARTFAIVEQEVTSRQLEQPQRSRLRVEVVLVETPAGWKVVDVETT
jgi:Mce-associated membrane protein